MTVVSSKKTLLDPFPAPEFLLLSTTGISIVEDDIRLIRSRRQIFGGGLKLVHLEKEEGQDLSSALRQLVYKYGAQFTQATLPEEKAYIFTTNIEKVSPEGLNDAVAFTVEENVPISLADAVFDFEIIGNVPDSNQLKISVTVLPKAVVNAQVELLNSAGSVPVSFDIESQAIARAIIPRGDSRAHLIINLSKNKTGFYVVEDEVVQFSTSPAYGMGGENPFAAISDLKSEMRKVLAFWNMRSDSPGRKIEKILICGTGASNKDFTEKLMEGSEVEYALADVWANAALLKGRIPKMPLEEALNFAAVIGLIMPRRKQKYV